jgi:hypothetical protein
VFSGLVWGINTNQQIQAVTISTSRFDTLYKGVVLGENAVTNGGATGTRIVGNQFDTVYAEGIVFGSYLVLGINASGHNIFYDVGNHFTGSTGTPATSIINIQSNNNVSISDLFERTDAYATAFPRVELNNTVSIATVNGELLTMGTYNRASGRQETLTNNTSGTVFEVNANLIQAFSINYTIVRDTAYRTGVIKVTTATATPGTLNWDDDYVENSDTGITLSVSQASTTVSVDYVATNTGINATVKYSVASLT